MQFLLEVKLKSFHNLKYYYSLQHKKKLNKNNKKNEFKRNSKVFVKLFFLDSIMFHFNIKFIFFNKKNNCNFLINLL
jgi:hypothetical protein